jgi:hypothetical protein
VTRNVRDVARPGVRVLDPFAGPRRGSRVAGGAGRVASTPMSKRTKKAQAKARRKKANHGRKPNRGRG